MNKVLIVGGAGYIGSHANKLLAGSGVSTVVFDDLSTGHRKLARRCGLKNSRVYLTAG